MNNLLLITLAIAGVVVVAALDGKQQQQQQNCTTYKWDWPQDFRLLSSNDDLDDFVDFHCEELRAWNWFQNGKYFCWKRVGSEKNEVNPRIEIITFFDDDHGLKCMVGLYRLSFTMTQNLACLCADLEVLDDLKFSIYFKKYLEVNIDINFEILKLSESVNSGNGDASNQTFCFQVLRGKY